MKSKWIVEIWTPYEDMDATCFPSAQEALDYAKKKTKSGYSSATIRPETEEYETWEFERALEAGKIE